MQIEAAARRLFAERGYSAVSVRDIAAAAGVDHSLILQRFKSKEGLFAATFQWPFDPERAVREITTGGDDEVGARLVATFLTVWDQSEHRGAILALVGRAVEQETAARMLREFVVAELLMPVLVALRPDEPAAERERRAALLSAQVMGLAISRYVLRVEPLASWGTDQVAEAFAPPIQRIIATTSR